MSAGSRLKGRYELREILGQGGMGVVYRAYDTVADREVALKTIRDMQDRTALEQFRKECDVQKSLNHPNIVDIYDRGDFEAENGRRPYFVMPLLRGMTLDQVIQHSSHRLTIERSVEIVIQVCRGLQAAHDRGLVHRDLKPSNIFVLEDDSVKLIDFGVAHLLDNRTSVGAKGTLLYMAPEQIQMKTPTALADIFALGVVCYETLTRRHPFECRNREEVVEAILHRVPPPASELNPAVNGAISQVVHAAMAKQPWHRISTAREFAECLQKASRNEPVERFNPAKIQPRIERAQKALDDGEYEFAAEVLEELQAEGCLHPEIAPIRRQIDLAIRTRTIRLLMEAARKRFREGEYQFALQKVQEVLDLEPVNPDALALRGEIENQRNSDQINAWLRLARQHMENSAFEHARQALQNVLDLKPNETQALELLAEVDDREQDYRRILQEKERLYQAALTAYHHGDVSSALTKLEKVLDLDRSAPDTTVPGQGASYQSLYNQIRSDYEALKNAYAEARKRLDDRRFAEALAICDDYLAKYPNHALFQALKFDIEARERQELSAFIARIDRGVEIEPDLERRFAILNDAMQQHPCPHFEQALQTVKAKLDLVNSIVAKARNLEERGQLAEALGQWEILRTVYAEYPGLEFEVERLTRRRDQQARAEAKARWTGQVDRSLGLGDYPKAASLASNALTEFPGDAELTALDQQARRGIENREQAGILLAESRALLTAGHSAEALEKHREAHRLDPRNLPVRVALLEALTTEARDLAETDWRRADELANEAAELDPASAVVKSIRLMIADRKRSESVDECLSQARNAQAAGDAEAALADVERGLSFSAQDPRLLQLQSALKKQVSEARRALESPQRDDLHPIDRGAATETKELQALFGETSTVAQPRAGDSDYKNVAQESEPPVQSSAERAPEVSRRRPARWAERSARAKQQISRAFTAFGRLATRRAWAAGGLAVAVVLAGSGITWKLRHRAPVAAPSAELVSVSTVPADASVTIDGKPVDIRRPVPLMPGRTYRIEARRDGYQNVMRTFRISGPRAESVQLQLPPLAASLKIATDLSSGKAALDGTLQESPDDGRFAFDEIPNGEHTLKLSGGPLGEAELRFVTEAGVAPRLAGPPLSKGLSIVVVGSAFGRGTIYASGADAKLVLDGQPLERPAPGGLPLENLTPGRHDIVLRFGGERRDIAIEIGAPPMLFISAVAGNNVGVLDIAANAEDFRVLLNNRARRVFKRGDGYEVDNVESGRYTVQLQKEGYTVDPASQTVEIRKGEHAKLTFALNRIPTTAVLRVRGAAAGSRLSIDGDIRALDPAGSLTAELPPGSHRVEIAKEGFKPRVVNVSVKAGQTVDLGPDEMKLEKIVTTGRLTVTVSPTSAQLFLKHGDAAEVRLAGLSEELPAGIYVVRAAAPEFEPSAQTVDVIPGKEVALSIHLKAVVARPRHDGMDGWPDTASWKTEGNWFVHRGGGTVLYGSRPEPGSYMFTISHSGGWFWKGVTWVVGPARFRIDRNYLYFQSPAEPKEVRIGRHGYPKDAKSYSLEVAVAPGQVTVASFPSGQRKILYHWKDAPAQPAQTRFGFFVPEGQEVYLANFRFIPRP